MITARENEKIWMERYRPISLEECCLPYRIVDIVEPFTLPDSDMPHLILSGKAGTGKTTLARALAYERKAQVLFINASKDGNIDTLRNEIYDFATTSTFADEGEGDGKIVILDEADHMTNQMQASLRAVMEEMSHVCQFILTCNWKNRIIDPIHSRCTAIDFRLSEEETQDVGKKMFKRCKAILEREEVTYDAALLVKLIIKTLPDMRQLMNILQTHSHGGSLDVSALATVGDADMDKLFALLKENQFTEMRTWVKENLDKDMSSIYRKVFDHEDKFANDFIPELIIMIHDYMSQRPNVADEEISAVAFLTHVMGTARWKN